ncbi:transglycosylase SLT domain-containing protein [Streptomyces sp. NPDC006798]|uniref:aggregation-promoting factor C-terminal-like domain-containing protein n=1 Tax=Streptomyces sp. NPDC006798 TaxID=3155462 RepID=UPI0033FD2AA6
MLEGNRVSRISVRGFAVASATAVTTVGAVVGVASGNPQSSDTVETAASDATTTLLADVPAGEQVQVQALTLAEQANAQSAIAEASAKKSAEESARVAAAEAAKDKKAAAEAKVKKEREEAKKRAARKAAAARDASSFTPKSSYSISEVKDMARQMVPAGQFQCFSNIIERESNWNYLAQNPSSGAYGLVQALPGSKMSSAGADWRTNPATQIKWGLKYMDSRYGSPCGAWAFWQNNKWY